MGKKSSPPPGPDYDRLLELSDKYAAKSTQLMEKYYDFFTTAYGDQKAVADKIAEIQIPAMQDEAQGAAEARQRYREMGVPFETDYLQRISEWDTPERRGQRAAEAQAAVNTAASAAREAELRRLEGYGIDPSQTRSAALDSQLRLQTAVQAAGAGNAQRQAVERAGVALGGEAVNLYRGLPSQAGASLATASGAGQGVFGNQQALGQFGTQGYGQMSNMNAQGFNIYNSGYNTAGNLHRNELARYEIQQQNSPWRGIGSLMGTAFGAAGAAGGFPALFGFAEGGPTDKPVAAPRPASQGIPPENMLGVFSPGEFVIPDDVARWEGEKNLQKLINKAREERMKTEQTRQQNQRALGIPA